MIMSSIGRIICLIPDWGQAAVVPVLRVACGKWYIPSGSSLFEGHYRPDLPPTRWGCWLIEIERGPREPMASDPYQNVTVLPWNQKRASQILRQQERDRLREGDVHRLRGEDPNPGHEVFCGLCGVWSLPEREVPCGECGALSMMAVDYCEHCGI